MREGIYYEYVYQKLFQQASRAWINAKLSGNKKSATSKTLENPYTEIFRIETEQLSDERIKKQTQISNLFLE